MEIIDANFILRYLLNDIKDQFIRATQIIENNVITIPDFIIAEVVYVLEKVYNVKRIDIFNSLDGLFNYPNIVLNDHQRIKTSLEIYVKKNIDFADSILIAYNKIDKAKIHTFDKQIIKEIKS